MLVLAVLGGLLLSSAPVARAEPSADQLRAQQHKAARLDARASDQAADTADARTRLRRLAELAGRALDAYVTARDQAREAYVEERAQRDRHEEAERVARIERDNLGRFASATYRNGGSAGNLAVLSALLEADSVTEMGRMTADLKWVGSQQSFSVDRLVAAERTASEAATAAAEAADRAATARAKAEDAKRQSDSLVAQQQTLVREMAAKAAKTKRAARDAQAAAVRMAEARRIAQQRRLAAARSAEQQRLAALRAGSVGPGTCQMTDTAGYCNGQLPPSALSPLWGAAGHMLRPDAAAAFNRMSRAYARAFGRPILVTDSYRSFPMQQVCTANKGSLCATPGTSNHGWGTAVDLGDGVNSFSTPTHAWMKANAPRFGWFLPGWADLGGSKPEPWHWEFGG